ncbi:MAG: pseudouridylate synthase [Ahrensia sp.]|nr:pseudouridylate synthase [Ahrensia sp.]
MANEDKPRGRPGKPAGGRATQGKGPGAKPRGGKDGEMRSRGFRDGPGGGQGGQQGGKGEMRSRGFKDNPGGGGKPGGKSRGFKDRPGAAGPRREGDGKARPYRDRPARDGDKPRNFRERPQHEGDDRPRSFGGRPERDRAPRPAREERPAQPASHDEAQTDVPVEAEPERISKYLARAGIASRRDIERMIEDGRVTLNGQKLETPAINVTANDTILVDGEPIPEIERTRLWLYHKPAGLVTTNRDPEGRPTVFEKLPAEMPRVLSVGRLDINTEGLLLLTNDGGLARVLELPQTGWLRRYRVRAHGKVDQKRLEELKNGIAVDGVFYGAVEATLEREQGSNVWITVGLREGKNREVKNILGALGLEVNRLIRISYGPFQLGELPEGTVQEIRGRTLRDQLGANLIAEANANFDAPVRKPFSNKPVRSEEGETRLVQVKKHGDWVSASPQQRPRRGGKGNDREEFLGRLDTRKPERREKMASAPRGETDKQRHGRASNVWMAPGARPQGKKPKPAPDFDRSERKEGGRPASGKAAPGRGFSKGPAKNSGKGFGKGPGKGPRKKD